MKRCSRCRESKSLDDFYRSSKFQDNIDVMAAAVDYLRMQA